MTNDTIAVLANVALALSFVVGLVFGIAQVRAAARDRRERLTLETLRNFQTREFTELMLFVSYRELPNGAEKWRAQPAADQAILTQFAQEMEHLGILVSEGLINIDLVDKTLGSLVTTAWGKYKTTLLELRETVPDPFLAEYFQWLAERIEERMRDHPRKPFYLSGKA